MIEVKAMLKAERKLIYAALGLISILLLFMILVFSRVVTVSQRVVVVSRNVVSVAETASKNTVSIAEIKANQDLYRQQYLNYIKDLIATMNKLQADNSDPEVVKKRGVKVPKMPVLRTPLERINESDLDRIPQSVMGPSPTPIVRTQTKTVIKYKKPKPTPKPKTVFDWFKKTR